MRYASMRSMDITNGENIGVSLFVQGCCGWGENHEYCKGCFNPSTLDFNGGKEWTEETKKKFLKLLNRPYITRCTILGGEPLAAQNLDGVLDLIKEIRLLFPEKTIYLYTGYTWEEIMNPKLTEWDLTKSQENEKRKNIVLKCNVLIDGKYEEDKRDITLRWRGSSNQRVISVAKSIEQGTVVLHCD